MHKERGVRHRGTRHREGRWCLEQLSGRHAALCLLLAQAGRSLTVCLSFSHAGLSWDEAHFGKFAGFYVKRQFYFDVHPPLGKLLLGAVAYLAGFDGQWEFPSSAAYPPDVPYVAIRCFCACLSAAAVPLVYGACRHLGLSRPAAVAAATTILLGTYAHPCECSATDGRW